ncbi:MAG: 30S ribosomal protein S8e [Candidatus Micrarchaeota archaeon]|nr:30S ribosomal protein S8e [Candidatus Micrarchaeota archaeon]
MTKWNVNSKRKASGGKMQSRKKKKKYQRGSDFLGTRIDEPSRKVVPARGGNNKVKVVSTNKMNVADESGKVMIAKVLSAKENKANVHFVRRNLITKGAILETDKGLAKVTSKPGKDGTINGVIIKSKK